MPGSPLVLILALSTAVPPSSGVATIADELAAAIDRRLAGPSGSIVAIEGPLAVLDLPETPEDTVIERLVPDFVIHDPLTFAAIGRIERHCGKMKVVGNRPVLVRLESAPECPPYAVGDQVVGPQGPFLTRIVAGSSDPALRGLVRLLADILPERLRRLGRYGAAPKGNGSSLSTNAEVVAEIRAAVAGQRLHLLVELVGTTPTVFHDVAVWDGPLVPEALWREPDNRAASAFGMASLSVPGRILDLGVRGSDLLVLTDTALAMVSWNVGSPHLARLVELAPLRRPPNVTRVGVGHLVVTDDGRACFATTWLADGWCERAGQLESLPGVPVLGPDGGLFFTNFVQGTNLLSGVLRRGGARRNIGPFLRAKPDDEGLVVLRGDGRLERLRIEGELTSTEPLRERAGDAFTPIASGGRLESSAVSDFVPDEILQVGAETLDSSTPNLRQAIFGRVLALAAIDIDIDGRDELVVAAGAGDRSRISFYSLTE